MFQKCFGCSRHERPVQPSPGPSRLHTFLFVPLKDRPPRSELDGAGPRAGREFTREDEMSRTINKVILVGNVGRDPDVFETKSGTKVVHLSLATNRPPFGDDDEQRTDWHRLTLWAGLAQFTEENVKKGDRIYVEGRLEYDTYEREGVKIPTADVTVRELVLLTAREAEVQVAA